MYCIIKYVNKLDFGKLEGFEWDDGNLEHIKKHNFHYKECEEVFLQVPFLISEDRNHSQTEVRYKILGKTGKDRKSVIIITLRNKKIRIISARDQSKKERKIYEKETKNDTTL